MPAPSVTLIDDFEEYWEPLRRRVFIEHQTPDCVRPFVDPSWEVVAIPQSPADNLAPSSWLDYEECEGVVDEYAAVFATLAARGVRRMCLHNLLCKISAVIEPPGQAVESLQLRLFTVIPRVAAYFSDEADWGMQTLWNEVTLLGGSADFMADFFHHAGGRAAVKQRFLDYDLGQAWALSGLDHFDGGAGRRAFYGLLGWDMPEYEP